MAAAAAVSWAGVLAHNTVEGFPLPGLENLAPALVALLLVLWWRSDPARGAAALLAWALLQLVGGAIVSVLPLPFLPFAPEQTAAHYAAHVVAGVAQLPLLAAAWRERQALRA